MKYLIYIFFILFTNLILCQTEKRTVFGIKGGVNKSYIISENRDYFEGTEFYGGFFIETKLNLRLNFQNELLFSYTENYHFLEFPISIKLKFNNMWELFLGPKLDFILDNDNDKFNFKNFGISAEMGAEYNISKRFFCEVRFGQSFTKQIDDLVLELFNSKRRTIRLGAGIRL